MKKHFLAALVAASFFAATSAQANGTPIPSAVGDGVQVGGAVEVLFGYQHDDQNGNLGGGLGGFTDFGVTNASNQDTFRFVANEVELNLEKTFGENIRLRTDIDFRSLGDSLGSDTVNLEQAYVSINLSVGDGAEWVFGRFLAPVGLESVDTRDNWFISYSAPYRYVTPTNVTGTMVDFTLSDIVNWTVAIVNDINHDGFNDSEVPSLINRIGFAWGDEGREHSVGLSSGFGPEQASNKHWDFFADLDALLSISDNWTLAFEGVYRQTNSLTGVGANQKTVAASLGFHYQASDAWYVGLRGDYQWEPNAANARGGSGASKNGGNWNGASDGTILGATLGAGYQITDGALFKMEFRYDHGFYTGANNNNDAVSLLGQFAYTF